MANIWDKFDKEFDTDALVEDTKDAATSNNNYKEVPVDTYEVAIEKLELTESSKGDPMFTCWMKIVEGEYKNSLMFMNQVCTQGFQIHIVNEFLRSLVSEMDEPIDVHFKTFKQYGNMIMDVAEAINDNFEYQVKYSKNKKDYAQYEVLEVYVLED
jgi:hypothetical protein